MNAILGMFLMVPTCKVCSRKLVKSCPGRVNSVFVQTQHLGLSRLAVAQRVQHGLTTQDTLNHIREPCIS